MKFNDEISDGYYIDATRLSCISSGLTWDIMQCEEKLEMESNAQIKNELKKKIAKLRSDLSDVDAKFKAMPESTKHYQY
jgi:hypothetical protein